MEHHKRPTIKLHSGVELDAGSLYIKAPENGEGGSITVTSAGQALFKANKNALMNELMWEVENALAVNERLTREKNKQ
jgi:hypothetical protein